jgi:hypothetical protein
MKRNKIVDESFGGMCEGNATTVENCPLNNITCPRGCEWGEWNDNWTVCNATCGDGYKTRIREINVTAEIGGKNCSDKDRWHHPVECKLTECPGM